MSHQTALTLHALGALLPALTHLTVPRSFRKASPAGCVLHKAHLDEDEIEQREGFQVTTPLRTLRDVASDGGITQEQLNEVVQQAIADGVVRRSKLEQLAQVQVIARLSSSAV